MKEVKSIVFFMALLLLGCSKNEPPLSSSNSSSSNGTNLTTTSCSVLDAQSNGGYTINAVGGSGNSIGIEVTRTNGAFTTSYLMQLLEVSNGSNCAISSTSTESSSGFTKFFEFKDMPVWAANTTTVAKVKVMLDGTVYVIQDLHVNQ